MDEGGRSEGGRSEGAEFGPVNGAVKQVGAAAVSFLLTLVYLGITVLSTTDLQLLVGHSLELPLLGVEVPIFWFFILSPILVVVLHLLFSVQVLLLAQRIRRLPEDAEGRPLLVPAILAQAFNRLGKSRRLWLLLRVLLVLLVWALPLLLLAAIQVRFLAYHHPWVTGWSQLCATAAAFGCLVFVPRMLSIDGRAETWWRWPRRSPRVLFLLCTALYVLFLWLVAVVPGTFVEAVAGGRLALMDLLPRDLDVSHQVLGTVPDLACDLGVAECACRPRTTAGGIPPGLNLAGRDLRQADLRGSILIGADLRGADLTGADLATAVLCHSDLSPGGLRALERSRGEASRIRFASVDPAEVAVAALARSDLAGADLRHALLPMADLRGTDLSGANLEHTDLFRADLRGATLTAASLIRSDLTRAVLDGADLQDAKVRGGRLRGVSARGVRARRLDAGGADLRGADLRGGSFAEARFERVDFTAARLNGSDLRGTRLTEARGLSLRVVDLRGAAVAGTRVVGCCEKQPDLVDARGLSTRSPVVQRPCLPGPSDRVSDSPLLDVLGCDAVLVDRERIVNTDRSLAITERNLHQAQVESMVEEACEDPALAAALVTRARGCVLPREPLLEQRLVEDLSEPEGWPSPCEPLAEALAVANRAAALEPDRPDWLGRDGRTRLRAGLSHARCREVRRELTCGIAFPERRAVECAPTG